MSESKFEVVSTNNSNKYHNVEVRDIFEESAGENAFNLLMDGILHLYNKVVELSNDNNRYNVECRNFADDFFLSNLYYFYKIKSYYLNSPDVVYIRQRFHDLKLYHYTSFKNLCCILESSSFLLSRYNE